MGAVRRVAHRSFRPGDVVPVTGIYLVKHLDDHLPADEQVAVLGKAFPYCEVCGADARFQLLRAVPYLFQDEDFREERKD